MQPRVVGLIATLSLATGWFVSTIVSENPQRGVSSESRGGPQPLGGQLPVAAFTQQLRLKLQEHPRSPSVGRNPFVFGSRRSTVSAANTEVPESARPEPDPVPIPSEPLLRFDLSGIATNRQDGAEIFTAIVNDNGSLAFVKAGEKLSNGYTVVRVEETAVVIADAAGVEKTLRLK